MKVTIGLICSHGFPVPAPFLIGFADLQRVLISGVGNDLLHPALHITTSRVMVSDSFPTDVARNQLVRMFLDHDEGDYLLFLDTDMKHPPDIAHRLVAHDQLVVTGRYQTRRPPFLTVAMRKTGSGQHAYNAIDRLEPVVAGLMPIDAAGAGALLIHRQVLVKLREKLGDDWFRYQDGPDGLRTISEDMWFFEQVRALGIQPYLDADVICAHVGQFEIDASWAPKPELLERAKDVLAKAAHA